MTQAAINYGRVLWEMGLSEEVIGETDDILRKVPELKQALRSPVVSGEKKRRIIDRVFRQEIRSFLKVLSDRQNINLWNDIFCTWQSLDCEYKGILMAEFIYAKEPEEEKIQRIRDLLCKKYKKKDVRLHMVRDPGLIGGFIIRVGDVETDFSLAGRLKQLELKLVRR